MKKAALFFLMAMTIVGAVIAKDAILSASSSVASEASYAAEVPNIPASASEGGEGTDPIADAIVTRSDVELTFTNDETYPWTIEGDYIKNGNCGVKNSTSIIKLAYNSEYKTELSFDWLRYNASSHDELRIYVDGVFKGSTSSSSYNNRRMYVEPGEHEIMFRDSIGNSTNTNNYSYIKNLQIEEIKPLESTVLTENSQPLTFVNDGAFPWTIEDGYIQNSNYGTANSIAEFSTTFTVETPSKFSFERQVTPYNTYYDSKTGTSPSYQHLHVTINGDKKFTAWNTPNWTEYSILLPKGTYTVEWKDTIANTTGAYYSRVRNVELSSNWIEVDVGNNPGTLGVEVLYKVNVLDDVELMKVSGRVGASDWAAIKQMKNLLALDLTDAKFDALPNNAFDGMSRLSSVRLPEGMKTIGEYAFRGTQLHDVNIPSTVTTIGQYAFYRTLIQSIDVASSVKTINQFAFAESQLRTINFDEDSQLEYIGYAAFDQCASLQEFIMPNSVKTLGTSGSDNYWDERGYVVYYSPAYIFSHCFSLKKLHFSDLLTSIPAYTCNNCTGLEEIHLPNNVNEIGHNAFRGNSNLKSVEFPQSLRTIGRCSFIGCGLESVKLPVTLSMIEGYAFQDCGKLKYVELPSYIGSYNINFYNCDAIETVVCQSATPPAILNDPFSEGRNKSEITLVVPSFAVVNYKLDPYWYQFGSIVEGDDIDYWKITGPLSLINNRRMNGKPDIDLYDGGKLTVGGAAPMEVGQLNYYGNENNPANLLNDCPAMSADGISTMFYFDANRWYFITPAHDVDLSKVSHTANASYVFRYYDGQNRAMNGTGASWKNVEDGMLHAGQGYIFQCNASGHIIMPAEAGAHSQILTTSDVTRQLTAYESATSANKSWNYVGNPYPCYYDIYYMDFTAPITVWTGSTYKAYSIVDDNLVLRPMQSFFVQKPDEVDAIIFHKEGRQVTTTIDRASYAKTARASKSNGDRKFFNLKITDDITEDETRIVVNEKAALKYEIERDASKFMSMDTNVPQLLTMDNDGNSYAINERPIADGTVTLGYFAVKAGFYTISAAKADGEIVLYDKVMNKYINLSEQDYTFQTEATGGVNTSRFTLILNVDNTATAISNAAADGSVSVSAADGAIIINADNAEAVIYTVDGRFIRSVAVNGTTIVNVSNGSYIVKVNDTTFKTVVY